MTGCEGLLFRPGNLVSIGYSDETCPGAECKWSRGSLPVKQIAQVVNGHLSYVIASFRPWTTHEAGQCMSANRWYIQSLAVNQRMINIIDNKSFTYSLSRCALLDSIQCHSCHASVHKHMSWSAGVYLRTHSGSQYSN